MPETSPGDFPTTTLLKLAFVGFAIAIILCFFAPDNADRLGFLVLVPATTVLIGTVFNDWKESLRILKYIFLFIGAVIVLVLALARLPFMLSLLDTLRIIPIGALIAVPYCFAVWALFMINKYLTKYRDRRNGLLAVLVLVTVFTGEVWLYFDNPQMRMFYYIISSVAIFCVLGILTIYLKVMVVSFSRPPKRTHMRVRLSNGMDGWIESEKFDPNTMEEL